MHPAFSVIFFTTLAGAAQGLVVVLAVLTLRGAAVPPSFASDCLALAVVLLVAGLVSSFFHLGRPARAWRSVLMWRTSWMSREVIVLPLFIGLVAIWWLLQANGIGETWRSLLLPWAAIVGAILLWFCTAMIYACLRFIQEWAHPLTFVNYTLIGLASGLILFTAIAAVAGVQHLADAVGPPALAVTLAAGATRVLSLRRNARLRPISTLQSATGIHHPRLHQKSMGMSGGAFNTREFFHGATARVMRHIKAASLVLCFAAPALFLGWGLLTSAGAPLIAALVAHVPGLLAERWLFFAQARHPQNLYYQVVA
jgi:DMSO reductase anchor subunit